MKGKNINLFIAILIMVLVGGGLYLYIEKNQNYMTEVDSLSTSIQKESKSEQEKLKNDIPKYILSSNNNSIYFDAGKLNSKEDAILSPDGLKVAVIDNAGLITIINLKTNETIKIDVLNGSTTLPGFSTVDYSKKIGYWYENKAYYNGFVTFISNDSILYPVPNNEYLIKNINTGDSVYIKGKVVYVFKDKYFIYKKDISLLDKKERQYILFDNNFHTETAFFNGEVLGKYDLKNYNFCNKKITFIKSVSHWPQSEIIDFEYYSFDVSNNKLEKIGESKGFQPSDVLLKQINNCLN